MAIVRGEVAGWLGTRLADSRNNVIARNPNAADFLKNFPFRRLGRLIVMFETVSEDTGLVKPRARRDLIKAGYLIDLTGYEPAYLATTTDLYDASALKWGASDSLSKALAQRAMDPSATHVENETWVFPKAAVGEIK